ncbi:MAG: sulfate/thiosulfate ABC transporter permease CysW, partial [Methylophilaceae bacterium]|nr:sulfate/thiosulfate ABC transporter permease CysW [Methylophilaceae bacterium]
MSTTNTSQFAKYNAKVSRNRATSEPLWIRLALIGITLTFLSLFLFVPLAAVFSEALRKGWETYLSALVDADALSAIKLTFIA